MKNRSIRFRITVWYTLALILVAGLTLATIRVASAVVLRNTIREYLVSVVEVNTDEITFVKEKGKTEENSGRVYVEHDGGFLVIDDDFMDTVSDVHSAIKTKKGELLYGENPLARETEGVSFSQSQLWDMRQDGVRYDLYDRKLNIETPSGKGIWVRGIVSEEGSVAELQDTVRISLIILPFLILAAMLLGYFISGRMLRPIREMEETASLITKGSDLKQRLPSEENGDELSKLADAFNDMIERLDNAFETERRFTSDASHELRTPMSVIQAQTEYILEKERTSEEYKEALEVVKRQGDRMSLLINDMLDITRMDQGAERYPMEDTDLSDVASEMAEQMSYVKENGIELRSAIEDGIHINGNRLLLSRLLQNLISNAYRYGRENGHIDVTLKSGEPDENGVDTAILSVSDDGRGMSAEEQKKVFDRFYRGEPSRTVHGTGLGLSMVKKIASLHDAKIELDSTEGIGSTFKIIFKKDK